MFESLFGLSDTNPVNEIEIGRAALLEFHNMSCKFPIYTIKFEELIAKVGGKFPDIFLEGFGFAIVQAGANNSQVHDAMAALVQQGQGRIPANKTVFFQAISNRTSNLTAGDWVSLAPAIAADVTGEVIKGSAEIGNALIDTGRSLLAVGPLALVCAAGFILLMRTKQAAGR